MREADIPKRKMSVACAFHRTAMHKMKCIWTLRVLERGRRQSYTEHRSSVKRTPLALLTSREVPPADIRASPRPGGRLSAVIIASRATGAPHIEFAKPQNNGPRTQHSCTTLRPKRS